MHTATLLTIQPDQANPPGTLGHWLTKADAELDVRCPPRDQLPAGLDGYDGLLVLGGGMGAQDDADHPWLADVRRLLAAATSARLPTLAVCLGAQLLSVATGGRAGIGTAGPEAGPGLVSKKDAAWVDPLFAELPLMQDVLQFHRDAIEQLPGGAELLASSPTYTNQAFRLNQCVYGIQFHIETTPEMVRRWAESAPDLAAHAREGALEHARLAEAHADIEETWRPFASRFLQLVRGELEPASGRGRSLPLG